MSAAAGQGEGQQGPVAGPDGRARPVGGQLQRGHAVQGLPPVDEFGLGAVGAGTLPGRVVGVADGQRGQLRAAVLTGGRVQLPQVPGQYADGPAVGDDVVHGQDEDVVLGGEPGQAGPQQGAHGQVERPGGDLLHEAVQGGVAVREVEQRQVHGPGRVDDLPGPAVVLGEGGAQRLVPGDQAVQGGAQGGGVQRAAQAQHGQGGELRTARLEPVEEPQTLAGRTTGAPERPGRRPG